MKPVLNELFGSNFCVQFIQSKLINWDFFYSKTSHEVTSIKQSPVLKGQQFFLSCHRIFHMN